MILSKNYFRNSFFSFFLKSFKVSAINKASLKERPIVSFRGYQIVVSAVYFILLLFFCFYLLISKTPLKEFLPQSVDLKKSEIIELIITVDSLEKDLRLKSQYINVVNKIISGEVVDSVIVFRKDSSVVFENLDFSPSKEDSILRNRVENEDRYNIPVSYVASNSRLEDLVFFKPAEGVITSAFDFSENHFGVDIVSASNASVKATLGGVVIFSDWSVSGGHTIIVQHPENIISVYMHNSSITKKNNELVKAGEVIGIVGNSGETSYGPHLHFELWQNGIPINPEDYIDF
ncbi:MAG: peptidase M23 [Flavobacteriales bacterium]|nr:peptidase M23 [Flavobacteriales bacterium]